MEEAKLRLSTRSEYGVMACYDLARFGGPTPVPLKAIAERQGLSESYLEQLVGPLRRAGLVRSVRGAQGGYVLARAPETITVGDVIRVLEGPIAPVDCVALPDGATGCVSRPGGCAARPVWEKLRDSMAKVLDSVSLADLVADTIESAEQGGNQNPRQD